MKKQPFTSKRGNIPKFPYSQAIIYGDLIFISAQPPVDPETDEIVGDDVKTQTRCILTNISGILEDAGTSLDNVLKVTVILQNRSLFSDFQRRLRRIFPRERTHAHAHLRRYRRTSGTPRRHRRNEVRSLKEEVRNPPHTAQRQVHHPPSHFKLL